LTPHLLSYLILNFNLVIICEICGCKVFLSIIKNDFFECIEGAGLNNKKLKVAG